MFHYKQNQWLYACIFEAALAAAAAVEKTKIYGIILLSEKYKNNKFSSTSNRRRSIYSPYKICLKAGVRMSITASWRMSYM